MNQFLLDQESSIQVVEDWPKLSKAQPIRNGPTKAGPWWAKGPDGRKLLVADTDKKTNEWMVHLPESIHDWPKWFKPDLSVWKDWKSV